MNRTFFQNPLSIEEAVMQSNQLPALPYNPHPVISKEPESDSCVPFEPVRAFDNVYWIGSQSVGAVLIDTGDGYILIDDGSNDTEAAHMADSLKQSGLNGADIRLIIISHEHFDHYGGTSYFLKNVCPKAKVAISRIGWNLLQTVPTEFAFVEPRPQKADILLSDGMCIRLGNTNIISILTPGHSDGCMSFIFNAAYHGEEISVGMMGGSAAWPNLPQLRIYQSSIEYFRQYTDMAGCNAFISAHQRETTLDLVRDSWNGICENPFICRKEEFNDKYLASFRNNALRSLRCHGLQTYMMPPSPVTGEIRPEGSPVPERL